MSKKRMLSDLELTEIGATEAVDGLSQQIDELQAEVRRLQQENDRMAVLVAYGYKSHLYEVAEFLGFQWREPGPLRLMPLDQIEAASTLVRDAIMQAALRGRALVEKEAGEQ